MTMSAVSSYPNGELKTKIEEITNGFGSDTNDANFVVSRKKKRTEWWKKKCKAPSVLKQETCPADFIKKDGAQTKENGKAGTDMSERPKLRNRETIAKPDSLKYEPNYDKGFHCKLMANLYVDTRKKKKKKESPKAATTVLAKRKSEPSPESDKSKKVKPAEEPQAFDSYTFSMNLINGNVDLQKSEANKETKKYVLFIGNLPFDVTREQLEEHFRKTGGVKSIRIPREKVTDKGKGFAYMEFDGRISHGIALRLHHTTLGGRKINVEFTTIGGGKSVARRDKLKKKNTKRKKMKMH